MKGDFLIDKIINILELALYRHSTSDSFKPILDQLLTYIKSLEKDNSVFFKP